MKKIKLAVVGSAGRMGQQIIKEIQKFKSINLIAFSIIDVFFVIDY